ncbi:DUF4202 domain-containing protein [Vreelandella andesensis]|nr:DUF4202 domain-containing protein [Halomonas andesensis]
MRDTGYCAADAERTATIIRKGSLGRDSDVQALVKEAFGSE